MRLRHVTVNIEIASYGGKFEHHAFQIMVQNDLATKA